MHPSFPLSLSVKTFHQKQTGDLQSSGLGPSGTTICNPQLIKSFPSLHYSLWLFSQALISAATFRNKASRKSTVALLLTTISVLRISHSFAITETDMKIFQIPPIPSTLH
jgi:hypothetical protein